MLVYSTLCVFCFKSILSAVIFEKQQWKMNNIVNNFLKTKECVEILTNLTYDVSLLNSELEAIGKTVNQTWLNLEDYSKMFGYARVVIVSGDSVQVLGSPTLAKRKFHNVSAEDTRIWEDIESKNYVQGGIVRVATFNCHLNYIINNETGEITGIETEIVKEVAKQLNLTMELVPLVNTDNYGKFGFKLDNGTWVGGIMGALYDRRADVAFCTLWMSLDRVEDVEYTNPWGKVELSFLVPRPKPRRESWQKILLPFRFNTWIAIISTLIFASLCHWMIVKTSSSFSTDKNKPEFPMILFGMFGALTQCSSMISIRHRSPLVVCWYIVCVILAAAFSSKIVSRLTLPLYTERIDTVQQLVTQGFTWGLSHKSNTTNLLNIQDYWHRRFNYEHFQQLKDEEIHDLIASGGKFAFPVQVLENYYVFSTDYYNFQDNEMIDLRVMGDVTAQYLVSILIVRGSPLFPAYNLQIQRLLAAGLVDHWKRNITLFYGRRHVRELTVEKDQPTLSEPTPMALGSFQGAFLFLFIGLSAALFTFLCELYFKN